MLLGREVDCCSLVPGPSGGDPEEAEGEEGHDERSEEVPEG